MNKLPIVKVPYQAYNAKWVYEPGPDGRASNMDTRRLPEAMFDAEVLTLHLKTGQMRVRLVERQPRAGYTDGSTEVVSFDISSAYFFDRYQLTEK